MKSSTIIRDTGSVDAPSTAVIEAIAAYHGTEPTDLDQPLYEVIDPDALDALFANAGTVDRPAPDLVAFSYDGCRVQVFRDGSIDLSPVDGE